MGEVGNQGAWKGHPRFKKVDNGYNPPPPPPRGGTPKPQPASPKTRVIQYHALLESYGWGKDSKASNEQVEVWRSRYGDVNIHIAEGTWSYGKDKDGSTHIGHFRSYVMGY